MDNDGEPMAIGNIGASAKQAAVEGNNEAAAKPGAKKAIFTLPRIQAALIAGTLLILLFNYFSLSFIASTADTSSVLLALEGRINSVLEASAKPEISLVQITDISCFDCFSLADLIGQARSFDASIAAENALEYDSAEARELIEKYGIKKIPSLIILGETGKVAGLTEAWEAIGSIEGDNALVLRDMPPVYLDLASGEYLGRVGLTKLVDSECDKCSEPFPASAFANLGVTISREKTIEFSSPEGMELVEKYLIEKIPTILLSGEINAYGSIVPALEGLGSFEGNGTYVMRRVAPLYLDINSGELVGETKVTYLTDNACVECYDVNIHRAILTQNLGLVVSEEEYIDVNSGEGQKIIGKYNISKIPTTILSGDLWAYDTVKSVWPQVGTIEDDGSHVFRELGVLGEIKYTDLSKENIINEEP